MGRPRSKIYGVGINDANYKVKVFKYNYIEGKRKATQVFQCPYYNKWTAMLCRCYNTKFKENHPTYKDCVVCEEWLLFSNFKAWMEKQDWEGCELDKDVLVKGNKIYSPETCIFIPRMLNTYLLKCDRSQGSYLTGVYFNKNANKFMSMCSNPLKGKRDYLGLFENEKDAHRAWLKQKTLNIEDLCKNLNVDELLISKFIEHFKDTNYGSN